MSKWLVRGIHGLDRSHAPGSAADRAEQNKCKLGGGGDEGGQSGIDPIIRRRLARLPKSGEVWPQAERKLWLDLLAGSFKLIYKDTPSD
jgi:hypothetical protein